MKSKEKEERFEKVVEWGKDNEYADGWLDISFATGGIIIGIILIICIMFQYVSGIVVFGILSGVLSMILGAWVFIEITDQRKVYYRRIK